MMELVVWAGGRLRAVRAAGGGVRVEGWRRRARLCRGAARGGWAEALRPARMRPLLLRRGPELTLRPARYSGPVSKPKCNSTPVPSSTADRTAKTANKDASIQTEGDSTRVGPVDLPANQPGLCMDKENEPPRKKPRLENDVAPCTCTNQSSRKVHEPGVETDRKVATTTSTPITQHSSDESSSSQGEEKKKQTAGGEARRGGGKPKELMIEEEDVFALRQMIADTRGRRDLHRFDHSPAFKTRVLFRWNPLVHLVRSAEARRLLEARPPPAPAAGHSSDEFQPKRNIRDTRKDTEGSSESSGLKGTSSLKDTPAMNGTATLDAQNKGLADKKGTSSAIEPGPKAAAEGGAAGPEGAGGRGRNRTMLLRRKLPVFKLSGTGRPYSMLEDHAIVSWLSSSETRERCVNGNRLWVELQAAFPNLTGQERSFHSLRNRYLRYILPGVVSLALPPEDMQRLRANAALGEIKTKKRKREESESEPRQQIIGASSRLRRPRVVSSPSPPNSPSAHRSAPKSDQPSSKSARSHSKSARSPVNSVRSASKSARSPVNSARSPVNSARSTVNSVRSTSKSARSPVNSVRSASKSARSPVNFARSPVNSARSTVNSVRSTSKSARSPVNTARSPVNSVRSITKSAQSPVNSTRSSVNSARSPINSAQSPVSAAAPPRTRSSYSELSRRFALRPRSTPQSPEPVEAPTTAVAADGRKRRLFNPNS